MNKKIITVTIDPKCSWKFDWSEADSWHSCVGEIIAKDKRKGMTIRLSASKPSKVEDKTYWHDQVKPSTMLEKALNYVFTEYENKLYCGLTFTVTAHLSGAKPEVKGMPENDAIDRSWMKTNKPSKTKETNVDSDASAAAAAASVL